MEITPKKVLIPILFAILIWVVAFFVIGWIQISDDPAIQALYLPMVFLFSLGTLILTIGFLWWYLPFLSIIIKQEWKQENTRWKGGYISVITTIYHHSRQTSKKYPY